MVSDELVQLLAGLFLCAALLVLAGVALVGLYRTDKHNDDDDKSG